jgi:hypothetical protein
LITDYVARNIIGVELAGQAAAQNGFFEGVVKSLGIGLGCSKRQRE